MPSERVQRQVDRLLDEAEAAVLTDDWQLVAQKARQALTLDPENADAAGLAGAAARGVAGGTSTVKAPGAPVAGARETTQPTSFANGRYTVTKFLGEGGKKKVYLARDSLLDRDVAFALIKTEGLDEASRVRVQREAQAMGRLGAHPHIVTVFDIGEENGQPYLVLPVLAGGDVEGVIEKAPENKLTVERAVKIALDTCLGLEFAHSKGIVHRDLKPGNVWLTEDGRAMIGDFGLAVAVDKSRLTQAGMMVGTVSYMPPEQAMGGEVGPRSDLYSLGAMLYEMVCGRPPFVGDESVAIIGQHLNTPPVAPSWHRPDCPTSLEALILRLLEKDPAKRPASATEVREALESVGSATIPARDHSIAAEPLTAGDNPLYRRTFVGRETEIKQVQSAFDAALSGQGGLVMVVGEPGIGKTALCEQLATYVALRGGKALVGHCYEEGSLSLPYLAFVEAMRSYVLAREPDGLRSDLGTGAADVARIVSEVRDRVQGVELRPAGDPEDDRWRLLQAVTSFLRNASTVQPLCIVLEDLHWADRGTLDLLLHASRNLQGARLLIVGTYRDVEVDRAHPLSGTLAELRRHERFLRVPLRGLTVDEVHRMYEAIRGNSVPWGQAETVHRATEGNPLFVQEVLRYLVEEGLVVREGGRYVATSVAAQAVPEGLRDVVGRRLSRLSEQTNHVLSVAAVVGRDFRLDVLQGVVALTDDQVIEALEEAQSRAIIEESRQLARLGFRFTHAFFRQTLYEEIFAARRIRWHQQVGRVLELVHAKRLEDHAAELAEHFSHSSDPADLSKAVQYGRLAAGRAMDVCAYGEAVRHLEQAIKAQEVLDSDDNPTLCALLLELADALVPAGDPLRAADYAAATALGIAEALSDDELAFKACQTGFAAQRLSRAGESSNKALHEWTRKARQFVGDNVRNQLSLSRMSGEILAGPGHYAEAQVTMEQGLDLARQHKHGAEEFYFLSYLVHWGVVRNVSLMLPLVEEYSKRAARGEVDALTLGSFFFAAHSFYFSLGHREQAEAMARELEREGENSRLPRLRVLSTFCRVRLAVTAGKIEEALDLAMSSAALAEAGGSLGGRRETLLNTMRPAILLGRPLEIQLPEPGVVSEWFWPLILAYQGNVADAAEELVRLNTAATDKSDMSAANLAGLLEAALMLGDLNIVEEVSQALSGREVKFVTWANDCVLRLLGEADVALGRKHEALASLDTALRASERMRFRPEVALTRLGLAELLLGHYPDERDAAIEHLDFAIAELRDMKMQPALERALRHRGLLKA